MVAERIQAKLWLKVGGGSAANALHAVNDFRKIASLEAPPAARVGPLAEATEWFLRNLHNFSYEADLRTETQTVR
jgi:hypothetical protein